MHCHFKFQPSNLTFHCSISNIKYQILNIRSLPFLFFILLIPLSSSAAILLVPSQYPTIQAGINAAQNADTVLVADGIYTGTGNKEVDFFGKAITVISANGPQNSVIDCEHSGRGFYFHRNEEVNSLLKGFKIIHGFASDGGGILLDHSGPSIEDCIINGNTASIMGGGISADFYSAPVIANCVISENIAAAGGGISFEGPNGTILQSTIEMNSAQSSGGGIFLCEANTVISECQIIRNTCGIEGGGIICGVFSCPLIDKCNISDNSTETGCGGGIYCFKSSSPIINLSVISGNSSGNWKGGGIYTDESEIELHYCLICNNSASQGGGICFNEGNEPTISNCTIANNMALNQGGGIYCGPFAYYTIVNAIVAGNSGTGGIHFMYSTNSYITYSDFSNNQGGNFTGLVPAGLEQICMVNANGDSCDIYSNIFFEPLFYSLTGDSAYYLTAASPCIDAGNPFSPFDPDSTIADIGAFYFDQSPALPVIDDLTITILGNDILLQWNPYTFVTSYKIYRSNAPYFNLAGMTPIATVIEPTYLDQNAVLEGIYFYRVTTCVDMNN